VDNSNTFTLGGMEISIGQGAGKKALPAGTKRSNFEGYEVVDVPAMNPNKGLPPPDLVQISTLEEWAQTAFKGYKTLNRIQSRIFQVHHRNCACLCSDATIRSCSLLSPVKYWIHAISQLREDDSKASMAACGLQTGYRTNANMLVCAPTGAGKTNIAMITVLHEIRQHMRDGRIQEDNFKIVYVAPMKALAAEVSRTFGNRLTDLGIQVCQITSPP
jgi:activating signal cointegrator complex subunit 3